MTERDVVTVGLVACGKLKLDHAAPARELYTADCPLCRPDYENNAERIVAVVLAAAYPRLRWQIETEVREQIAQEIEVELHAEATFDWNDGMATAARLARGAAQPGGEQ